ncbi:MAG: S9 family peptidase [Bacteroidota bacterium]
MRTSLYLFAPLFLLIPILLSAQLTADDHLRMERISNLQVYGDQVVYRITRKRANNWNSYPAIVKTDLSGRDTFHLTSDHNDYDLKWSPDGGKVSFIAYRNNLQQVFMIPAEGGDIRMISDAQAYLSKYDWIDNNRIAYVDDEPRDSTLVAEEKANGGGYWVGTEFFTNALWAYDITTEQKEKLTDGSFRIIEFDISPDGQYLALICAKNYDSYEAITNSWVAVLEIGTGRSVYRFADAESFNHLRFSPNGEHLAFAGSTAGFAANDGLFLANLTNGSTQNLTFDFDPTIYELQWMDEEHLSFLTPRDGKTGLYQTSLQGDINTLITPHWVISEYQIAAQDILFIGSYSTKLPQLYRLPMEQAPANAIPLTQINASLQDKIKTSSTTITYSSDGLQVQGIVTFPPNYDSTTPYPLMVIPHGGPDAVELDGYDRFAQFFADNGYLVFRPNFRGSIAYGRAFYAGNRNAFGQTDFADIMAGVDQLVEMGIADENRLVIGGWSYGGYMANWAITQTDRFKAAISVAGISNLVSLYGQHEFSNRDIGVWEYYARPIDAVENYRKASPIFFVEHAETPLLILHGANDNRSPTLQAWEMYRAMKDAAKTVEMMIYPRARHSISYPTQFRSVMRQWLEWADSHISKQK